MVAQPDCEIEGLRSLIVAILRDQAIPADDPILDIRQLPAGAVVNSLADRQAFDSIRRDKALLRRDPGRQNNDNLVDLASVQQHPRERLLRTKLPGSLSSSAKPLIGPAKGDIAIGGLLADEFIPVLITTVAMKLSRGSTNFYRSRWNVGMLEWRVLLVLERTEGLNVRELAKAAGLDKSAVSRSLSLLQARSLVDVAQTRNRGRAAFASLTASGRKLCGEILAASRSRQQSLFKVFPKADVDALARELCRLYQALEEVHWDLSPEQDDE